MASRLEIGFISGMNWKLGIAATVLAALAALTFLPPRALAAGEDFYEGRTITIYVGRGPGAGSDLAVRTFARFWRRYIPGEPTMIVRNMPGGGGTRVWNYAWEKARPDGLEIFFSPVSGTAAILEREGMRADYSQMPFIGGLLSPNITYTRTDKVKSAADLLTAKGLKFAGQNPVHRFDILGRLGLDMLGVDYKYVTGFRGGNDVFNAVRRGEVDIQTAPLSLYRHSIEPTLVAEGLAIPLWHNPTADADGNLVPIAAAGDIPSFMDLYRELKGEAPSGEKFEIYKWLLPNVNRIVYGAFLPPGSPEAQLEILRQSFVHVTADEDYLAAEKKMFGFNLPLIDVATGTAIVNDFANAPEHVKAYLRRYIREGRQKR